MTIKYNSSNNARISVCSLAFTLIWLLLVANPTLCLSANPSISFSIDDILEKTEKEYGEKGARRLQEWRKFIIENRDKTDSKKVESVNRFINTITSKLDSEQWNREDYWATPYQFIASGGGDCEDFSIAKYFTLRMMGVTVDRTRIAYVNVEGKNEPHMVLFYFPKDDQPPLVLDNLEKNIMSLDSRTDMELIYSADEDNVWVNKDGNLFFWAGKKFNAT
jgi:predicted transglutaminase-like cysteine proteinase